MVSFLIGIYCLTEGRKMIRQWTNRSCGVVFLINAVFWMKDLNTMQTSVVRISPGYKKMLVLKQDKESGRVTIYKNQKLWFARPSDEFPFTASEYMTTPYVTNMIRGRWVADNKNLAGWSIETGIDGIIISNRQVLYCVGSYLEIVQ